MHLLQKIYQNKKHSIHGLILLQILIRLGVKYRKFISSSMF